VSEEKETKDVPVQGSKTHRTTPCCKLKKNKNMRKRLRVRQLYPGVFVISSRPNFGGFRGKEKKKSEFDGLTGEDLFNKIKEIEKEAYSKK
jgi:hypothetical protein